MDPQAVRSVGASVGDLGPSAQMIARELESLHLPPAADGRGAGPEIAPVLAVWSDGLRALGTELLLLEQRCAQSARDVEAQEDRARHRFAGLSAGAAGRSVRGGV
ncbi:hypothetical protein V3N99_12500 [Dermatophilaceae bacterium Soc4.6]